MVLSPVLRVVDNVSGLLASVSDFRRKRKNVETDSSEHNTPAEQDKPKKLKLTPVSVPAPPRRECPQCKAGLPGHISHILS